MPLVLIACPETWSLVPSGLTAASVDELDDTPQFLVGCLACGGNHVWEKWEATVSPDATVPISKEAVS
jgi:hypothetical protein